MQTNEATEPKVTEVTILSVDAWRNGPGWDWNQWYNVGKIDLATLETLKTNRQILAYMRREGYLSEASAGKVGVEDDQYNIVITERSNGRPLFAIAYGEAQ